jgi:hypothetical protein
VSTTVLLCFALPTTAGPLAAVIVAIVAALGVFWAPASRYEPACRVTGPEPAAGRAPRW